MQTHKSDDEKGKLIIIFYCDICGKEINTNSDYYEQIFYMDHGKLYGRTYCNACYNKSFNLTKTQG